MKEKRFSFSRLAVALMAAIAMLSTDAVAQNFTPNLFPGQKADRTELEVSATVRVGDYGKVAGTNSYVTNLASTDESVVRTFNESGHTVVLVVGVGTADVTYTEQMYSLGENGVVNNEGEPTHHTIHYTVEKGQAVGYSEGRTGPLYDFRLVWTPGQNNIEFIPSAPSPQIRIWQVYLRQNKYPEMTFKYLRSNEMQWESTNPAVATVAQGVITPVAYGQTTIRASWPGDENWIGTSVEYNLTVEAPKQHIYVNFYQTEVTGFVGESMSALPNVSMYTIDSWESRNPEIASVDEKTGKVTFNAVGSTEIIAHVNETTEHYAGTGYYTVNVRKRTPNLSFSEQEATAELGVPFTPPTLNNPYNVTISKWSSSDPNVVEVNETTGELTIKNIGSVYITCSFNGNDLYEAATATYILHVTSLHLTVMGVNVTSLNCDDVLGDGQKQVTYNKTSHTLTLNGWNVDAAMLPVGVKQGVIRKADGQPLYIELIGVNSIMNATNCIVVEKAPLVIMSADKDNSLALTATEQAIRANALKVYDSNLYAASNNTSAIELSGFLTVLKGGHVKAETLISKDVSAIQCTILELDPDGIGILTKDVVFVEKHGFALGHNSKTPAPVIEIGKLPVVASAEEETTIDFNMIDPEDNSSVVFSVSANDTYNAETGQLEISTTLTDEQVATALETLIPGSSAWVALLPGSLVFDVPAGKGDVYVKCLTLPGFTINVMIEGQGAVSITQEKLGWAKVSYDVATPTHVVIYLHGSLSAARSTAGMRAAATTGGYISAVNIVPENVVPTAIDVTTVGSTATATGWYDLSGRRLAGKPAMKGIYVKDGKKAVIK